MIRIDTERRHRHHLFSNLVTVGRALTRLSVASALLIGGLLLVGIDPAGAGSPGTIVTEISGLSSPHGLVYDAANNSVYVSDTNSCQVLQDDLTTSTVTPVVDAGGVCGSPSSSGTPAANAQLDHPHGLAIDTSLDQLYIADRDNHGIEVVNLGSSTMGNFIPLLPGAPIAEPVGVTVDQATNTLYVADQGTDVVWSIPSGGSPSVFAGVTNTAGFNGNGIPSTSAYLNEPSGVDFVSGTVYIADTGNNEIRSVSGGTIQDVIGSPLATAGCSPDGSPTTDPITAPSAVRVDGSGNMFFNDTGCELVREIGPGAVMETVAGTPPPGGTPYPYSGDPATSVALDGPHGMTFVPDGAAADLWSSDTGNNAVDAVIDAASGAGFSSSAHIDSADFDTATVGSPFSFEVTTTGTPVPVITSKGKLPKGVTFVDNDNGTATISGTPISTKHKSAQGTFELTLTAKFGKGKSKVTDSQDWWLSVPSGGGS